MKTSTLAHDFPFCCRHRQSNDIFTLRIHSPQPCIGRYRLTTKQYMLFRVDARLLSPGWLVGRCHSTIDAELSKVVILPLMFIPNLCMVVRSATLMSVPMVFPCESAQKKRQEIKLQNYVGNEADCYVTSTGVPRYPIPWYNAKVPSRATRGLGCGSFQMIYF